MNPQPKTNIQMKLDIRHYKPQPRGADESPWFYLGSGIPFALLVGVIITSSGGPEEHLVLSTMLVVFFFLFCRGVLLLWRRSPFPSVQRDRSVMELVKSGRKFALLLRPFEFDGLVPLLPSDSRYISEYEDEQPLKWNEFEEGDKHKPVELFDAIAGTLALRCSLVAVGERKRRHRGGPGLLTFKHGEWQSRVAQLIESGQYLFIMPWPTAGTLWELNEILARGLIEKTVFVMPPTYGIQKVRQMVTRDFMENAGEVDLYYKVPIERLEDQHRPRSVAKRYLEAALVLEKAGLATPRYDPNGCIYFYRSQVIHVQSIPYFGIEMAELTKRLSC